MTTAQEGKRYRTAVYNLEAIMAVGFRVDSAVGTRFRQWATERLREYLVKSFVLGDVRHKEGGARGHRLFSMNCLHIRNIRINLKLFHIFMAISLQADWSFPIDLLGLDKVAYLRLRAPIIDI